MEKDSFEKMLDSATVPVDLGHLRLTAEAARYLPSEGPTIEDLIEQGYLSPTGRLRQSPAMRFGQRLHNAFSKARKAGMPPEMAAPYGHSCPDLNAIYGADVYTRGALEGQAATIAALKESLAGAHRSTARYMALAFLGWAAVVIMGVVL